MKLAQSSTVIIHPTVPIVPASKEESNNYNEFKIFLWYKFLSNLTLCMSNGAHNRGYKNKNDIVVHIQLTLLSYDLMSILYDKRSRLFAAVNEYIICLVP